MHIEARRLWRKFFDGSLVRGAEHFPLWSMVVVESSEDPVEILAGPHWLELLVLQFPRETP